jgi:hypothetical protein
MPEDIAEKHNPAEQFTFPPKNPFIIILSKKIEDFNIFKKDILPKLYPVIARQIVKNFEQKIEENANLDPILILEEVIKQEWTIFTFDGSIDRPGTPFSETINIPLEDLFKSIIGALSQTRYLQQIYSTELPFQRLREFRASLNNQTLKLTLQNFDHHPFCSESCPVDGGSPVDLFYDRYSLPSSCQQMLTYLQNNHPKNILALHEPFNAADTDSLMCLFLINIFKENPSLLQDPTLKMLVDFVSLYDVWGGSPTQSAIKKFIDTHQSIISHIWNEIISSSDQFDFEKFAFILKHRIFDDLFKTINVSNKPKTPEELMDIVNTTVKIISDLANQTFSAIQNISLKDIPEPDENRFNELLYNTECYESDNIEVILLPEGMNFDEITALMEYYLSKQVNKAIVFILPKGSGIYSFFAFPSQDPSNLTDASRHTEETEAVIKFKEALNKALSELVETSGKPESTLSIFSDGAVCGNRKNPVPNLTRQEFIQILLKLLTLNN